MEDVRNEPPTPIMEFSQDDIDLLVTSLTWWRGRIDNEVSNEKYEPIGSGHRAAGSYARSKIGKLIDKLNALVKPK